MLNDIDKLPNGLPQIGNKLQVLKGKIDKKIVNGQKKALEDSLTANVVNHIVRNLEKISKNLQELNKNKKSKGPSLKRALFNQNINGLP